MNHRKLFASVVALLIVMQCICTPITYALDGELPSEQPSFYNAAGSASDSAYKITSDAVYTVLSDTVSRSVLLADGTFTEGCYDNAYIHYNRPTLDTSATLPGGSPVLTTITGNRLALEGGSAEYAGIPYSQLMLYDGMVDSGVIPLASETELGRIPDYEFDGWYVYGGEGPLAEDSDYISVPLFMDDWTDTYSTISVSSLIANGEAADDGNGSLLVNEGTAQETISKLILYYDADYPEHTETYYNSFNGAIFPLIAKWRESANAYLADASASYTTAEGTQRLSLGSLDSTTKQITDTPFSTENNTYYIRVGETVDSINLDLAAFEPYLEFRNSVSALEEISRHHGGEGEDDTITYAYTETQLTDLTALPVTVNITPAGADTGEAYTTGAEFAAEDMTVTYDMLNDGTFVESYYGGGTYERLRSSKWQPNNSDTAPASSKWVIEGIPLAQSANIDDYNVIEITVTAPDGITEQTYTFYVQRMNGVTIDFAPGNTPAGAIAREVEEGRATEAQKTGWLNFFKNTSRIANAWDNNTVYKIVGSAVTSSYDPNNEGKLYDGMFSPKAWNIAESASQDEKTDPERNLDFNEDAIVAYQNYTVTDPGFTITMSSGAAFVGAAGRGKLERSIELSIPATDDGTGEQASMLDALIDSSKRTTVYYGSTEWESIDINAAGALDINLEGKKVLPGIYTIKYKFTDPFTSSESVFERPLVVLAIPGDVDMDGVTTVADSYALSSLLGGTFVNITDPGIALFAHRVCNVAGTIGDTVDTDDASALAAGWRPFLQTERIPVNMSVTDPNYETGLSDYFYIPLNDPADRYTREEDGAAGEATVTLDYEKAEAVEETPTASIIQRRSANEFANPLALYAANTADNGVALNDVFWVTVTAKDLVGMGGFDFQNIESFTFTLAYDNRYIRPATMQDMNGTSVVDGENNPAGTVYASFDDLDTTIYNGYVSSAKDAAWASWATVMFKYNLRANAGTAWSEGKQNYSLTLASQPALAYDPHFSKLSTEFETLLAEQLVSGTVVYTDISEMVFSIKFLGTLDATAQSLDSDDEVVLRVPFFMHEYPDDYEGREMPLISFDLGMQELVVVTDANADENAASYDDLSVAAYSAQSSIYGDSTANVYGDIRFGESAVLSVLIASDNTPYTTIYNENDQKTQNDKVNAQYGTYFSITSLSTDLSNRVPVDGYELPPGLSLSNGQITGTPTKAGVYRFRLRDISDTRSTTNYEIVVERRPLEIYAVGTVSYYGEADYTTDGYKTNILDTTVLAAESGKYPSVDAKNFAYQLEYRYLPEQIVGALDTVNISDTVQNNGSMQNLPLLVSVRDKDASGAEADINDLKFTHPTLSSTRYQFSSAGAEYPVSINVGDHEAPTDWEGLLENYYFVVANNPNDASATMPPAAITVVQRPFIVTEFNFTDNGAGNTIEKYSIRDTDPALYPGTQYAMVGTVDSVAYDQFESKAPQGTTTALDGVRKLYNHGEHGNLPLSETGIFVDRDSVKMSFSATFVRTEADRNHTLERKNFYIADPQGWEPRDLDITGIAFVEDGSSSNYVFEEDEQTEPITEVGGGIVNNVAIDSISLENWTVDTELEYGERVTLANSFRVCFKYGSGTAAQLEYVAFSNMAEFIGRDLYVSLVNDWRMAQETAALEGTPSGSITFGDDTDTPGDGIGDGVYLLTESLLLDANTDDTYPNDAAYGEFAGKPIKYYIRIAYAPTAAGETRDEDTPLVKTAYSPQLIVSKKTITLRANPVDRYYGEDTALGYTFAASDLAAHDRTAAVAAFTDATGRVSTDGLLAALGYENIEEWNSDKLSNGAAASAPVMVTLSTRESITPQLDWLKNPGGDENSEEVDRFTDYTPAAFYIGIYGAAHKNYDFLYERHWPGGVNPSGGEFGYHYGQIHQRPIVLATLPAELATAYTDVYDLTIKGLKFDTETAGLSFILPPQQSYWADSTGSTLLAYDLSRSAVVDGDKLGIVCDITMLPGKAGWQTLADGHFTGPGSAHASLESFSLDSDLADTGNYILVFANYTDASKVCTSTAARYTRSGSPVYTYTRDGSDSAPYYVDGSVTLVERPIKSISIVKAPNKHAYTYGETFDPTGLTVEVTFETTHGPLDPTAPTFNGTYSDKVMPVDADTVRIPYDYTTTDNFGSYGLSILSSKGATEAEITYGQYLTPAEHGGGTIVVCGQRSAGDAAVNSSQSANYTLTVAKKALTLHIVDQHRYYGEPNYSVRFVKNANSNAPGEAVYEYYFNINELATPDYNAIIGNTSLYVTEAAATGAVNLGYGYATSASTAATESALLEYLSDAGTLSSMGRNAAMYTTGYDAPTFNTAATAASPVGEYALTLSGGATDNYELVVDAERVNITVYPRPIRVDGIYAGYTGEDSTDRSIYSIFTGATQGVFNRTLPYVDTDYSAARNTKFYKLNDAGTASVEITNGDLQPNYTSHNAINDWYWFDVVSGAQFSPGSTESTMVYRANYLGSTIPNYAVFYISRDGIVNGDNPGFNVTINASGTGTTAGIYSATATVAQNALTASPAGGDHHLNYALVAPHTENNLPVRAEKRTIKAISIFSPPTAKALNSYTYGETLDLSGLVVRLEYTLSEDESNKISTDARYNDGSFEMYGLTVSYYPGTTVSETDYTTIASIYRRAESGDHLTIAPVHDSDTRLHEYGRFAHHGKYLLVSAVNYIERDGNLEIDNKQESLVEPKFIRERSDTDTIGGTNPIQQINVAPKVLEYNLRASNKSYDGTTRAVGSIEFTNVYTGDLIYAKTGETYEGSDNWTWVNGGGSKSALQSHIAANRYAFTSGSVVAGRLNNSLSYTNAGGWDAQNTLRFEFIDENVRYANDTAWDVWEAPIAMNVEVTDIILRGPDAANYTFVAVTANAQPVHDIDVTGGVNPTNHSIPTAVITRAKRDVFDTASLGVPKLEIDDRTGVVRLLYNSKADEVVNSVSAASAAERLERTGVTSTDDYDGELHIEYAIEYFLPENDGVDVGNLTAADAVEYLGANGNVWQDTYYFGGEAVGSLYDDGSFYPAGFVNEEEEPEEMGYDSELVGQLYKWTSYDSRLDPSLTIPYTFEGSSEQVKLIQYLELDEDDNLLPREDKWLFDGGFVFNVADTNVEARVIEINGESYYYFYGYYTTDRDPIPRGAYVLGKVRAAATHNYDASEPLYTHGGGSVTDAELGTLVSNADAYADDYADYIDAVAADDREGAGNAPTPLTDVVRMYEYRLDLRYAEDKDSANEADETTYDFRVLRAVQFTDYTPYSEQEQFDAVVYNDIHNHYSGYFWDDRYQNQLEFDKDAPIYLGSEMWLEVDRENREPQTQLERFNYGSTIPIYVEVGGDNNLIPERWIDIKLDLLEFYEDDEPFDLSTLEVEFYPPRHHRLELSWTSSDESVVRITADGMLEIVGVGTAILTATSFFEKTDTITVIVHERPEEPAEPPKQTGIFNHELLGELLGLDADYFFYPEREMTRGELVMFASLFFIANDSWTKQEAIEFIDVVGDEPYAEAVALLSEWGVIVGVGGDMFAGERIATRAEAAAILTRMLGIEPADYVGAPTFSDSTVHDTWAVGYIAALRALGVTNGIGNNLFAPNRGIIRAEAAAMFGRLLNHQTPTPPVMIPADVSEDHWAFGHIVRAVNNVILPEIEEETETETEE